MKTHLNAKGGLRAAGGLALVMTLLFWQGILTGFASSWVEQIKVVPTSNLHDDIHLGNAVDLATDASKAIVGGNTGNGGYGFGRAVPLSRSSSGIWARTTKLGDDEFAHSEFGFSVGISEQGLAVIGAPHYYPEYGDYGKIYFWKNTVASFWEETDRFFYCCSGVGEAVAISGNLAALGYPSYFDTGVVEIYQDDGTGDWHHITSILPSDLEIDDFFGSSVSLTKTTDYYYLAIGAPGQGSANTGAVYIYRRSTSPFAVAWTLDQKITLSYSCMLGGSVSISADLLAIGEMAGAGGQNGRAAILKRQSSGWNLEGTFLVNSAGNSTANRADSVLGGPVAIAGSYAAFGAPGSSKVFTYFRNAFGWSKLATVSGTSGSRFGEALDMATDGGSVQLMVGAPNDDSISPYVGGGAAQIFRWQ